MSRLRRAAATLAAAAGLMAGGVATAPSVVAAPSAVAADCWRPAQAGDFNIHGYATGAAISNTGPYAACQGYEIPGGWVYVDCKYKNTAGNWRYYTDWGWIYSKYLSWPYGSPTVTCTKY